MSHVYVDQLSTDKISPLLGSASPDAQVMVQPWLVHNVDNFGALAPAGSVDVLGADGVSDQGTVFVVGVAGTSNPTVTTIAIGTFSAGDIVIVAGTRFNDGLYEVDSHAGTVLELRGVGVTATTEVFFRQNLAAESVVGGATIQQVRVCALRSSTTGVIESVVGNSTPLVFAGIGGASTLQGAYNGGGTIDAVVASGANLLQVRAADSLSDILLRFRRSAQGTQLKGANALAASNQSGSGLFLFGGTADGTGNGGPIDISAGTGGSTGSGAPVTIVGGAAGGGNGLGGDVILTGGIGAGNADGGIISLEGGTGGTTGNGGGINIITGQSASDGAGGDLILRASAGLTSGAGGKVDIDAGDGVGGGNGGEITMLCGDGGLTNGIGGQMILSAGDGGGTGAGGDASLGAGNGGGTGGDGGDLTLQAGNSFAAAGGAVAIDAGDGANNGMGGAIAMTAGNSGMTGVGGSITLQAGVGGNVSDDSGDINLRPGAPPSGSGDGGNVVIGTGPLVTTATAGFLYISSSAGAPTGVPPAKAGRIPFHYDSTGNALYAYNAAWRSVAVA